MFLVPPFVSTTELKTEAIPFHFTAPEHIRESGGVGEKKKVLFKYRLPVIDV